LLYLFGGGVYGFRSLRNGDRPGCVVLGRFMSRKQLQRCVYISLILYKQNGIGKLIGMPVARVTAVWWEVPID